MKQCVSFAKGLGVGIVLGATAAVMCKSIGKHSRRLCKKTSKAARTVSDIMDELRAMIE